MDLIPPGLRLEDLARIATLAEPVYLVAAGGTGKSTTLIDLAGRLLADGPVPLFVPLGAWSDRDGDFFDCCVRRNAFGAFRRQHLMQLAHFGQLALLLDGWNEIDPKERLRATRDVASLRREYPQLGIVISTRPQALPAGGGRVVDLEQLSQDQQIELARAVRGEAGVALVDQAWRTKGVRDLVAIPLYLNALLALPPSASFPETREAVLRMFVNQNEYAPDRTVRLKQELLGHHTTFLQSLAVQANRQSNGVFKDSEANRVVSCAVSLPIDDKQIGPATPHPHEIIAGLTEAHLLLRFDDTVRFQHQLFQEWYAAAEVQSLMLRTAEGEAASKKRLREEVLNCFSWEESILFACDRLSRAGELGVNAVAIAIESALGIDPILAAKMIDRAAEPVWIRTRDRIQGFVDRWHKPGICDRAVRFMVESGRPEFEHLVWPLASNADGQVQFAFFRAAERFRPAVLGVDREANLRTLPVAQRKLALAEIASNSGFDGMELAARLASDDSEQEVVVAVVEALAFRSGDRLVNRIMQLARDDVWRAVAAKSYPFHFTDPTLDGRLSTERTATLATEADPVRLLNRILFCEPSADAEKRIIALLESPAVDFKNTHFSHAVARTHQRFANAIASGFMSRLASGLSLPYDAGDYLQNAATVDGGPVARAALDPATPAHRLNAAAAVIGPATVAALFDQLITLDDRIHGHYDKTLSDAHIRLVGAITLTRQQVFAEVLVARGNTDNERHIRLMADLLARHGGHGSKPPIDDAHRAPLRGVIQRWIATLLDAPGPGRGVAGDVARAAERLADPNLAEPLRLLLEKDLTGEVEERATRRPVMVYSLQYARAFAAMREAPAVEILTRSLSDLCWGLHAAGALFEIWSADHLPRDNRIFRPNLSDHLRRRAARSGITPATSEFAEAIFAVVREFGEAGKSDAEQLHAIALAATGLGLPHGDKRQEIASLLSLRQPIECKQRLLLAAAHSGEIVSAEVLMEGMRSLLLAAQSQPWRLDENRGELMSWMELFPFSDDPAKVHEALALLAERYRHPHALHRLLNMLPYSPVTSALTTLERLAADNPAFLRDSTWTHALMKLETEGAGLLALRLLSNGSILVHSGYQWSQALTGWAKKYPSVRSAMIEQYRAMTASNGRGVVETAMANMVDDEIFWTLFDGQVNAQNQSMPAALRNLALRSKPSENAPEGWFDEFRKPLAELRSRLFALLPAGGARARLAEKCLIQIEAFRDEHGRLDDEPRHPDIATGRAWPLEG
jgi:hypothetical protein